MNKYVVFVLVCIASVAIDLGTKTWAEQNLATQTAIWEHYVYRDVAPGQDGMTVREWVADEFGVTESEDELEPAEDVARYVYVVDEDDGATTRLPTHFEVEEGQTLEIRNRQITVVGGFWDMIYVRNPGAAWGLFADRDESFRRPFFLGVSFIAIVLVMFIFRGVRDDQKLLIISLSFIVGGAIGNLVDRIRYGYVVDFIEWYVVTDSGEKHWPTFNLADVFITIGVALMIIEILFGSSFDEEEEAPEDATDATAQAS